jgi:threonine dehydrogenase-like Zn-dependent dehydrogenase
VRVGSKTDFQELVQFLEEKEVGLESLIDRTFEFGEAKEAFKYLEEGKHVGKVVIKV